MQDTLLINSKVGDVVCNYIPQILKEMGKTDLPDNVILNKVTTGSGMTSVALLSPQPYVVAVPNTNLIKSKLHWSKENNVNLLGVYAYDESGVGTEQIEKFTGDKIMVTYDSLYKVVDALKKNGRINDFKLMVDESHMMVKSGSLRAVAIQSVVDLFREFPKFIFGTATPIQDKYQLPELKSIRKAQIQWHNLQAVTVNYCVYYKDLLKAVAIRAIAHIDGESPQNAHFFINSVQDIVKILKYIKAGKKLNVDDVKVVVADSKANAYKLSQVSSKLTPSDINQESCKINFYTSTAFQGCDIHDNNGLIYVVSNGGKDHTKIDITTELPQIIGRLRDTKYSHHVNFMYSPNRYFTHTTVTEFEQFVMKQIGKAETIVNDYSIVSDIGKETMMKGAKDNLYLMEDREGRLRVNYSAINSELQNYETVHTLYHHTKEEKEKKTKVNDFMTSTNNGITYNWQGVPEVSVDGLAKVKIGNVASFTSLCEEYSKADTDTREAIAEIHPVIEQAYKSLGYDKVKTCKFRQDEIKKALLTSSQENTNGWKVANLLDLRVGEFISAKDAKDRLNEAFKDAGIDRKAKGSDLTVCYEVKTSSKRFDGSKVKGYVILAKKYKDVTARREAPKSIFGK